MNGKTADSGKNDGHDPSGPDPSMPHDRDESAVPEKEDGHHRHNREVVEQGRRDVESGIQDTERIGVPTEVPTTGRNDGPKT